ncbi:F0F1 ATP synthase subunit gamma [Pseudofulvimonas gallinarii]|jgi:F-type H+-transporting ATPase subunit gamma|uniref:ATP synthase gamma chain n=1 Tax=Pseudofulvimonas gallinarii TaxID=634155 RepID=A0A4S3KTY5_9GAMM|nr:F0F1 ATP synthase subunit gamma [Pseudofulvimonas gallinarii]TCS97189.1 ATP synthase F1 subcomplex gamma subunit [Pseudofulvimonas gallinarii]THD12536.1 F0F1 ATP synthase subunit gamma [Pseudofulvimonas gallinarii]
MAGGREIKTKIKSVQNTRKVTRALEMVSASKIRKAQDRMRASRPYARLIRQLISHIGQANTDFVHPFLTQREETRRVGYIVVSSDRGLAGGLNSTLFRRLLADMKSWQDQGVEVDVVCIGQKATAFFRRLKVNLLGSVTHLGERPQLEQLVGVMSIMLDGYSEARLDRVFLCYNDFINTMAQKPRIDQLLPLPVEEALETRHDWDYIYEPDAETVLNQVLTRYVESLVYQAVLENLASEHAARMVAMKSASDNATKLIDTLNLSYNKARQAAITQEISEIVGGAAAV